jgi:hypothetical protein
LGGVREVGFVRIILVGLRIRLIVFVGHLAAPGSGGCRGKKDRSPEVKAMRTWITYQKSFGILGDF